ncbi:dihydrofolate reductase [Bacillus testis]|uniref:dihydrofolate reductase n=1 Tax=Bacillus testis TaxID=1622072 RepID=UPI00067EEAC9|nr:dihydrofolate reductase [Bacillus testis]
MIVSMIVAMDEDRVIGKDNKMPWRIPRELQYVKKVTMGHPIVMGRKNYESIGRPLPGRRNLILTRDPDFKADGCEVLHSKDDVYKACQGEDEVFIFGGEQIYKLFLNDCERLYITRIHHSFGGDTFFPEVDLEDWEETYREKGIRDEKNDYDYVYHVYEKKEA